MSKPEFDKFAKEYDQVLGETIPDALNDNLYFAEYKIRLMANRLKGRAVKRVLDFGCGAGRSLPFIKAYFPDAEVWGFDVSPQSLKVASANAPGARLFSEWSEIGDVKFDVIISANVFHHIPLDERLLASKNCRAALDERGLFYMFEHNPYNPMTRWIFERCPFDADAEMLTLSAALKLAVEAGFGYKEYGYTLFFPKPLAFLRPLEAWLKRVPMGAQYYVEMGG